MRQFGLIGYRLSHSFSKEYFTDKFIAEDIRDCHYENFPLESIDEFKDLIREHPEIRGLNVTIPYKETVMEFLDELDDRAVAIGAVNTIRIDDGRLTGYNTDCYGFEKSIEVLLGDRELKALVLGTGGASKAVANVLNTLEIPFQYISRLESEEALAYHTLTENDIAEHQLIINTTPLGMFPKVDECPAIPYDAITDHHILYDLVYNPGTTLFLKQGLQRGAQIKNGLEMLELQAERAWAIWNDY